MTKQEQENSDDSGYLTLQEAVCLVAGGSAGASMNSAHPGWSLLSKALSAKQRPRWPVRQLQMEGTDDVVVHAGDFVEWAWENGFKAPDKVLRQMPETEFRVMFRQAVEVREIEDRIEELKKADAETVGEILQRDERLAELEQEKRHIEQQSSEANHRTADHLTEAGCSLDHNQELQAVANTFAKTLSARTNRRPNKSEVVREMVKEKSVPDQLKHLTENTLIRRLRREWR